MELKELKAHEYETVKGHSEKVRRIVVYLAKAFNDKGIAIDSTKLEKAAILHDIFKPMEFSDDEFWTGVMNEYKCEHEDAAYRFFEKSDIELAKIIQAHAYDQVLKGFRNWEEKILYYADKRVEWDQIMDLGDRLTKCHLRYTHLNNSPEDEEYIKKIDLGIFKLEKEIFDAIGKDPSVLNELNGDNNV